MATASNSKRAWVVRDGYSVNDGKKIYQPGEEVKLSAKELVRLKRAGVIETEG